MLNTFIVLSRQQISPREIVCSVLAVCLFGIIQRCAADPWNYVVHLSAGVHHHCLCLCWDSTRHWHQQDATREAKTWEICIATTIITFSLPFWRNQSLFCHCVFRISVLEGMKSTSRSNWVSFFWDVEPHKIPTSEKSPMIIHPAYCIKCFQER